jgi:hypothetical protein|uniref:Rho termination factor N-terminal domain-containing protein n=1 Tax=viral metagenome TaxID=1070528 RepID=A0A6C0DY55_9ZZZZ
MGFFNLIESAFFASLAITFVLVIMLVYHFKERLVSLEKKYDTMFQILNRVVKELKNLHENDSIEDMSRACLSESSSSHAVPCPMNMFSMFNMCSQPMTPSNIKEVYDEEDDDEDDEDDEGLIESSKIVVSDAEEEEDDDDIKIINIDIGMSSTSLIEIVDEHDESDNENDNENENESTELLDDIPVEVECAHVEPVIDANADDLDKSIDYKRMDVSYLRELVASRGLATDPKKLKKGELIKLLSDE